VQADDEGSSPPIFHTFGFNSDSHIARLRSLSFPEMHYRQLEVQNSSRDTCRWLFEMQAYRDWIRAGHGLLWIKGKPGSGKSTLMKRVIQSFDGGLSFGGADGGHVQLSFFFHRRGTSLQQSQIGMFRTMLYQLLREVPSAREGFRISYDAKSKEGAFGKNWDWEVTELRHLFKSTLMTAAKAYPVRMFVDALDEAGEEAACAVVSYLHSLNLEIDKHGLPTSICFSCRHYPIVTINSGSTICVEDQNMNDIAVYSIAELRKLMLRSEDTAETYDIDVERLQMQISSKASGVFLWAALVVPLVSKQYNEGQSYCKVSEALKLVPSDLGDIYEHILRNVVDPSEWSERLQLMQWICMAEEPLSLARLRIALACDNPQLQPGRGSYRDSTDYIEDDIKMRKRLVALSGGLAEVKEHGGVHLAQFIHQSVNDFLSKGGFACIAANSTEDLIGHGHHRMARSCLNYLQLREVYIRTNRYGSDDRPCEVLTDAVPFVAYAASSWILHAEKAEQRGISQEDLLQRFQWPSPWLFRQWVEIFEKVDGRNPRLPAFKTTFLHIAADSGLLTVILAMLKHQVDVDEEDSDGRTALDYAYYRRHYAIAGALLIAGATFDDATDNSTALERASGGKGYEPLVKFLIDNGHEVNTMTERGGALQCAAQSGNLNITQLLLNSGANVNAEGGYFGTALSAAATHSHHDIVQLLLDYGANINTNCGVYGNALQAAAASASENVSLVNLLLRSGADVRAQSGLYGTALSAASFNCYGTVISLLLKHDADINSNCGLYGTALQAAAASKSLEKVKIVKMLLDAGADVNERGGQFITALRASESQDGSHNTEVARLLVQAGAVNIDPDTYSDQESLYDVD
jgi:ankyrin repeat protein